MILAQNPMDLEDDHHGGHPRYIPQDLAPWEPAVSAGDLHWGTGELVPASEESVEPNAGAGSPACFICK